MKKRWRIWIAVLLCLCAFVAFGAATALGEEDTIYRHWDEETGILTFDHDAAGGERVFGLDRDSLRDVCGDIREIHFDCRVPVNDGRGLFFECRALHIITGMENLDTSGVTDMSDMFCNCHSLTKLDLSGFDTANVTDMSLMFDNCYSLTELDLSGFDSANVEDMHAMFSDCMSLTALNLRSFNTAKVRNMWRMFEGCASLTELDLSGFDTARVESMGSMLADCDKLQSLTMREDFGADCHKDWQETLPEITEIRYVPAPFGAFFRRAGVWISRSPIAMMLVISLCPVLAILAVMGLLFLVTGKKEQKEGKNGTPPLTQKEQ